MLSHLKVLDLTHYVAGPYCTRLFAGYGAEVIKVERVNTGDRLRACKPFIENIAGLERSIPFHWLNAGKQSITLNLKHPNVLELLRPLIETADILVENFRPETMSHLGLSYDVIRAINPRIVMTSISNFGETGPYRDFRATEMIFYALSGGMSLTGDADQPPLNTAPLIMQYTAGLHAYMGSLMAFFRRFQSNTGEHVKVSIHESALSNIEMKLAGSLQTGKVAKRNNDQHLIVPWECYPTTDGYAAIVGGPMRRWQEAATMFEDPDLLKPPLNKTIGRMQNREATENKLKPWVANHSKHEVYHQGQEKGLAFGYLANLAEVFQSRQHQAREFFQATDSHPEVGSFRACRAPFQGQNRDWQMGRAPLLGEHNQSIYGDRLNYSPEQLEQFQAQGLI